MESVLEQECSRVNSARGKVGLSVGRAEMKGVDGEVGKAGGKRSRGNSEMKSGKLLDKN